uniref:GATA-type domain-containing protein n=1 Tax=Mycena chlorophos TaxID=658473 RepID=A0ABQ0LN11_MYCCL|nr:predicted protein [Mycena chlorophos]
MEAEFSRSLTFDVPYYVLPPTADSTAQYPPLPTWPGYEEPAAQNQWFMTIDADAVAPKPEPYPGHFPFEFDAAVFYDGRGPSTSLSSAYTPQPMRVKPEPAEEPSLQMIPTRHQSPRRLPRLPPFSECPVCRRPASECGQPRRGWVSKVMVCNRCGQYEKRRGAVRPVLERAAGKTKTQAPAGNEC